MRGKARECVGNHGNVWEYVGIRRECVADVVGNVGNAGNDVKDRG